MAGLERFADIRAPVHNRLMEHNDVTDRATFVGYVANLRASLDDPSRSAEWENADLRSFLDGMAAWAIDWTEPADSNPWRHVANVLTAASIYE
jgi:hypothetical protein